MRTILIVGLGRFGKALVRTLSRERVEVIAIDPDEKAVAEVADLATRAVVADGRDREVLAEICEHGIDVAVVAVSEKLDLSAMATMILKELKVPEVVARADTQDQERLLRKLGADRIIVPIADSAERLARSLASASIENFLLVGENFAVVEREVTPALAGKTLKGLELRRRYGVTVIGILERSPDDPNGKPTMQIPDPGHELKEHEVLLVIGRPKDLERFDKS